MKSDDFISMTLTFTLVILVIIIFTFYPYTKITSTFTQTIDGSQYIANYTTQNHWQAPVTCKINSFVVYTSQNGKLTYKNIYGNQTALGFLENQTGYKNCTYAR